MSPPWLQPALVPQLSTCVRKNQLLLRPIIPAIPIIPTIPSSYHPHHLIISIISTIPSSYHPHHPIIPTTPLFHHPHHAHHPHHPHHAHHPHHPHHPHRHVKVGITVLSIPCQLLTSVAQHHLGAHGLVLACPCSVPLWLLLQIPSALTLLLTSRSRETTSVTP